MTIATTTFTTFDAKGIREQLSDVISNISPTETPFLQNAGKGSLENTFFEFQTDALAAAVTTNAQIEGDELTTYDASVATVRLGNYAQIARKSVSVSRTEARKVKKAGRGDELSYQTAKKGKELKRDMESGILCNQAANAGSTSTARKTASFIVHIKTNVNKAANGVIPVYTTLANDVWTNGTQRAFSETILKDVVQQGYESGAEVDGMTLMVGSVNKQLTSTFSGIATRNLFQTKAAVTAIVGAVDLYVSDFGDLHVVPNRFQRSRDALFIDWDFVSVDYLDPFNVVDLAKTGDADKKMLIVEYGVRVDNEKAHGIAVDLS